MSTNKMICQVILASFIVSSLMAFAQMPTATIIGVVKNKNQRSNSGCGCELLVIWKLDRTRNHDKCLRSRSFRLSALPVGPYESSRGAAAISKQRSEADSPWWWGQEAVLNFALQVGAVAETVECVCGRTIGQHDQWIVRWTGRRTKSRGSASERPQLYRPDPFATRRSAAKSVDCNTNGMRGPGSAAMARRIAIRQLYVGQRPDADPLRRACRIDQRFDTGR